MARVFTQGSKVILHNNSVNIDTGACCCMPFWVDLNNLPFNGSNGVPVTFPICAITDFGYHNCTIQPNCGYPSQSCNYRDTSFNGSVDITIDRRAGVIITSAPSVANFSNGIFFVSVTAVIQAGFSSGQFGITVSPTILQPSVSSFGVCTIN